MVENNELKKGDNDPTILGVGQNLVKFLRLCIFLLNFPVIFVKQI